MPRVVTGDSPKSILTTSLSLLTLGVVLKTELADENSMINTTAFSGKQLGGMIVATDAAGAKPSLFMALGNKPSDDWLDLGATGSYTLPAATSNVIGGVKMSAATADQAAVTVTGVDVTNLATSINAALATIVAKINAILAAERAAGQKVT